MNSRLLALLCSIPCLLFAVSSSAQISLGVKGGVNFYDNYQQAKDSYVSKPGVGFHGGIYGDYALSGKFSVRAEGLFSTRGFNFKQQVDGSDVTYNRQASYIDIPVSLNYNVFGNFSVHAGVVPSLFIQEFRSETLDADGYGVSQEPDQYKLYERWQLGVLAGASYNFSLFGKSFDAGARYSMAVSDATRVVRDARAGHDPRYMMVQAYLAVKLFEF